MAKINPNKFNRDLGLKIRELRFKKDESAHCIGLLFCPNAYPLWYRMAY